MHYPVRLLLNRRAFAMLARYFLQVESLPSHAFLGLDVESKARLS